MKKTKLLTSLAAFVLVLGLGACELPEETTSDESGEVSTTDTEDTSEGETTPEGGNEPVAYAIVGDFDDNSWNESPATDSVYYIPAGTEHYEATVEVPTADTLGYEPSFRVVEYGTWNLVADYDNLDVDNSTGVTGSHGGDNNIELAGGTYDLVFDFGETNSILVTLQTGEGGDEGEEGEEDETIPGTNYAIGETYWLGYEYNDALYAFTGAIVDSNYGGVVTDTNGAASVTLGKAEGGYTLSVDDAGTTKYVAFSENNTYRNFALVQEAFVWEYNATYDTFVALDSTSDYVFIGNYYGAQTYFDELRISSIGYLDGTKSSSYTQLPAHLYTQDTPTALTITGGRESLYVGNTVKLGIEVANRANHDVTWSSSDATSISVDAYGTIEALALAESVTITATSVKDENVTASINIAVIELSTGTEVTETITKTATNLANDFTREDGSSYTFGSGNGSATDYIEDGTVMAYDDFSITWNNGSASTGTRFWSGPQIRIYQHAYFTIALTKENATLDSIVITCASNSGNASYLVVSADEGTLTNNSNVDTIIPLTGVNSITVTQGSSGNTRIESFAITYTYIA